MQGPVTPAEGIERLAVHAFPHADEARGGVGNRRGETEQGHSRNTRPQKRRTLSWFVVPNPDAALSF